MLVLITDPILKDFQKYVSESETKPEFVCLSILDKCLLLGEEIGELYKAVHKWEGLSVNLNSHFS